MKRCSILCHLLLPLLLAGCADQPEKFQPGAVLHGSDLPSGASGPAAAASTAAVVMPQPLQMTNPEYPPILRTQRMEGDVVIDLTVQADGTIANPVVVSSPDPAFSQAALDAVANWSYRPGLRNGQPASFRIRVPIHFAL